jgi:GNAT superfamily N-acetyltransferase
MVTVRWVSRLTELIEDWNYLVRHHGCQSAVPEIVQQLLKMPYQHLQFVIVARSLAEPLPDLQPKIELEIRLFEQSDLEMVRQIDRPSEAHAFAIRLEYGHKGLIALYQGLPIGYAWGCGTIHSAVERVNLKLELGDALFVDAYTVPAFRGKGIQTALSLARFQLFRELGYQRAIAYIEKHNSPSLNVWRRVGAKEIGGIDFLRIGPWRRTRYQ